MRSRRDSPSHVFVLCESMRRFGGITCYHLPMAGNEEHGREEERGECKTNCETSITIKRATSRGRKEHRKIIFHLFI